MINLLPGRRETGRARDHLIIDIASHIVSGHEVGAPRKTETAREVEVQEETETGLAAGALEKIGHGVEVQEETKTGHVVGVLRGKDLEAEAQKKTGIGQEVLTK